MKFTRTNRGFTLIELLVVIAIIGILSSVVLASLNTARSKGNDAKVKAQLSGLRAAAEIYYDNNNGYGTTVSNSCVTASTLFTDTTSGMSQYTTLANYPSSSQTMNCYATASAYAVSVNLSTAGQYWCVDSTGKSKQTTAAASTTACP